LSANAQHFRSVLVVDQLLCLPVVLDSHLDDLLFFLM
jgi:hypothetical protein